MNDLTPASGMRQLAGTMRIDNFQVER